MLDASIFEGKSYKLEEFCDHNGRSKMEGSRSDQEKYQYWVGCYTNDIRIILLHGVECLKVQFAKDADGNYTSRHLRTTPIQKIEPGIGRVIVHTANSVYTFVECSLPEPEVREANNLLELWLGSGDHRFDKGVHYDAGGNPHILQLSLHLGTMCDSFLICHRENPHIIIARYFSGYQGIQFYDTLPRQQDYSTPILVHNTADYELSIRFQFSDTEHRIAPGTELLFHPPKRRDA